MPAVLTEQLVEAEAALVAFRPLSRVIHVDVMDGSIVPGKTLLPADWPLTSDYSISWHLMVAEPEQYIDDCLRHATDEIIVHAELGVGHLESIIRTLNHERVPIGLAINPETSIHLIASELPKVQSALVMTIEPGAQGQPFLQEELPKIAQLRNRYPNLKLAVDGGINPATIHSLLPYRPARVVVGSWLKVGPDLQKRWETLRRLSAF